MNAEESRSKIHVLIVDDEPLARSSLTVLLRLDSEIGTIRECESGAEALAEIMKDLVFQTLFWEWKIKDIRKRGNYS